MQILDEPHTRFADNAGVVWYLLIVFPLLMGHGLILAELNSLKSTTISGLHVILYLVDKYKKKLRSLKTV